MTKIIYLAWQDQITRLWHVVGQLLRTDVGYEFRYTHGVNNTANFSPLPSMPEYGIVYRSPDLFSLFKNRLMSKSRPDYIDYMNWMGIKEKDSNDDLDALGISGGERETDSFRTIPVPEKNSSGDYSFKFFVNGLSHMPEEAKEMAKTLKKDDILYLAHDFQNPKDTCALFLRTEDPPCLIGYLPAYFAKTIHKMREENKNGTFEVKVIQMNKGAPIQKRLLCELSSPSLNKPWDIYEDEFKLITTS